MVHKKGIILYHGTHMDLIGPLLKESYLSSNPLTGWAYAERRTGTPRVYVFYVNEGDYRFEKRDHIPGYFRNNCELIPIGCLVPSECGTKLVNKTTYD